MNINILYKKQAVWESKVIISKINKHIYDILNKSLFISDYVLCLIKRVFL